MHTNIKVAKPPKRIASLCIETLFLHIIIINMFIFVNIIIWCITMFENILRPTNILVD